MIISQHGKRYEKEAPHSHRSKSHDYDRAARRGQLDYDRERRDSRDSRRDDDYYSSSRAVAAAPARSDYDSYGGGSRGYDRGGDSDEDSYTKRRSSRRDRD